MKTKSKEKVFMPSVSIVIKQEKEEIFKKALASVPKNRQKIRR